MASFDHERPRTDQRGHFGIVERAAKIPLKNFVLARPDITEVVTSARVLQHPFVEVGRADGQTVIRHQCRNTHGRLPAVAQAVECDTIVVDEWLRLQPVHDLLVLRHDDGKQRLTQWLSLPLESPKPILKDVRILRRERDESSFAQLRRKIMVGRIVAHENIRRTTFQAVLTNHDRSLLTRLQVFRQQQNSKGEDIRENIQHDFVASPFFGVP